MGEWLPRVDDWFTEHYAGEDWRSSGLAGTLPWKELPLSSVWAPLTGMALYLVGIVVAQTVMDGRQAIRLPRLMLAHNLLLSVGSAGLFAYTLALSVAHYRDNGWEAVWNDPQWTLPRTRIPWCNYVFYVSKYYELLDTLFLILKKRKLAAVQVWHHTVVLPLFWSLNNAHMDNHFVLVLANTGVHVLVYGYFTASILGIRVPFKRYITMLQIGQFVFDMVYAGPWPWYKLQGRTRGDWGPVALGYAIGVSFVVLFLQIYFRIAREERHKPRRSGKQE